MKMTTVKDFFSAAKKDGYVEFRAGLYLWEKDHLIEEQASWDDADQSKGVDFSAAPFWLTTDDGQQPQAIHDVSDLEKFI
jgi:hypothetical protein